MSNYDPYQVPVEITEGALRDLNQAVQAARGLMAAVQDGAHALEIGADPKAMAAYFRVVAAKASAAQIIA